MPAFPKLVDSPVAVGVVEQSIVGPFSTRGEDIILIVIENSSATETLDAYVRTSPTGTSKWYREPDDAFGAMAPLTTRRYLLPPDRLWAQVLGQYQVAPATARVSLYVLTASWL